MSFEPRDYLRHIVLEADYLIGQTPGLSYGAFVANETLCRAFVRSLEVIGEAAKKVPQEFRAQYPEIRCPSPGGCGGRASLCAVCALAAALLTWTDPA